MLKNYWCQPSVDSLSVQRGSEVLTTRRRENTSDRHGVPVRIGAAESELSQYRESL